MAAEFPAEPQPSKLYSKQEIDLKLESTELRLENKLDRILTKFDLVDVEFKMLRNDFSWLKWITGGTFFLILSILMAAAIKYLI